LACEKFCKGEIFLPLKLFREFTNQIKDIVDGDFGIIDETGKIMASTNRNEIGHMKPDFNELFDHQNRFFVVDGVSYMKVMIRSKPQYIVYITSDNKENEKLLELISLNIANMKLFYDDKYDRTNLIKNIIIDNILPGDISQRAKELHLDYNARRVAFLIKTEKSNDAYPPELIQNLFPDKVKDFVIELDDEQTVLIKQLRENEEEDEIEKIANTIVDTLNTELMVKAVVSVGTVAEKITDLGRSFKEAQTAMLIGGIFESEKTVINYNKLGLGRLIYQLPTTLCRLFLKEVFQEGSLESLDAETLHTIQKFFENNLNVSETARQLYVHRNTLVYRLDKIKKITGLDLREFDDAIIFKVSMLVKRYLDRSDSLYINR